MQNLLEKLGEKNFLYFSALFSFLGDVLIAIYLYLRFADYQQFHKLFTQSAKLFGATDLTFSEEIIHAQFTIMLNSLKMMLGAFLLIHFFVYIAHAVRKIKATKYLKFSLIITLSTSALFIYEAWSVNKIFSILFLIQTPIYWFCYQGITHFHLTEPLQRNTELKMNNDQRPPTQEEGE